MPASNCRKANVLMCNAAAHRGLLFTKRNDFAFSYEQVDRTLSSGRSDTGAFPGRRERSELLHSPTLRSRLGLVPSLVAVTHRPLGIRSSSIGIEVC